MVEERIKTEKDVIAAPIHNVIFAAFLYFVANNRTMPATTKIKPRGIPNDRGKR